MAHERCILHQCLLGTSCRSPQNRPFSFVISVSTNPLESFNRCPSLIWCGCQNSGKKRGPVNGLEPDFNPVASPFSRVAMGEFCQTALIYKVGHSTHAENLSWIMPYLVGSHPSLSMDTSSI